MIVAVKIFYGVTEEGAASIYLGGLLAGAVGAAGTMLSVVITVPHMRKRQYWLLTIGLGAVAGLLVGPAARFPGYDFLPLFMVWQGTVAACVGYQLAQQLQVSVIR